MSHQPERKEKDCLNCGAIVQGRYCQNCGQENIVTHQNFLALTKHFIYDIFHFDGKFFDTLRYLLFKPGFVAKEYVNGKRGKYLDPIRMYLFTSAIFFLIFFSLNRMGPVIEEVNNASILSNETRREMANEYTKDLNKSPLDTILSRKIALLLDTTKPVRLTDVVTNTGVRNNNRKYYSVREYDSVQLSLTEKDRDSYIVQAFMRKRIEASIKYQGNETRYWKEVGFAFLHKLPYILFVSLPFFAGLLKLLYIRHKSIYYSDHAVFTLYHYIFSFILLMVIYGVAELGDWLNSGFFGWLTFFLIMAWFYYLYRGMRNFYIQGRGKTLSKFFLLMITGFILIITLLTLFFLFTAYQL